MMSALVLSVPLLLAGLQERQGSSATPEDAVFMGRAFLFQADLEAARALGWVGPEATDEEILQRIEATLYARTRNSGRFVEAQVAAEPDRVFSVTFVGRMAPAIEEMLIDAMSRPARVELATLATDVDLDGVSLAEERERLRAWLAGGEGRRIRDFQTVARDGGGPHAGLRWVARHGAASDDVAAQAVPLLRAGSVVMEREKLERAAGIRGTDEREMALALWPGEDLQGRVAAELAREVTSFWLIDDVAVEEASPFESYEELRIGRFTLDELRGLVLGLAGEPLCAPLSFLRRDSRPLKNVVRHVPGDDD